MWLTLAHQELFQLLGVTSPLSSFHWNDGVHFKGSLKSKRQKQSVGCHRHAWRARSLTTMNPRQGTEITLEAAGRGELDAQAHGFGKRNANRARKRCRPCFFADASNWVSRRLLPPPVRWLRPAHSAGLRGSSCVYGHNVERGPVLSARLVLPWGRSHYRKPEFLR